MLYQKSSDFSPLYPDNVISHYDCT